MDSNPKLWEQQWVKIHPSQFAGLIKKLLHLKWRFTFSQQRFLILTLFNKNKEIKLLLFVLLICSIYIGFSLYSDYIKLRQIYIDLQKESHVKTVHKPSIIFPPNT